LPLAIYTRGKGYRAYRVKTPQLHDRRKFYQRHCKTDPLDSKAGAQVPDEVLEELYLPDRHYLALERATRQQEKLTFPLQREKLRIAAIVDGFISGLPRACGQPFSLPARAYIKAHLTVPEESRRQRRKRGRRGMNFLKNFEKRLDSI
jgi:hypothetical protein